MARGLHLEIALLMLGAVLFCPSPAHADATKRLILKDGSYQVVTKWEIQGDRVHYYSAERDEWEDVPNAMVDWDATNQFEKDRQAQKNSPEAKALDKELEEERKEEEAKSPTVAPGLRLPPEGGVYALDIYLSEPQLLPLDQSTGQINKNTKKNILRAAVNPVSGSKMTIELPGARSKIQVHAALPTFYVNLDPVEEEEAASAPSNPSAKIAAELPWDRFRIVRVQVKGDKRIVGAVKTAIYGKSSAEQNTVTTDAEQLGEGWVKITPKEPLAPGEYALAEMLGKQGINSYVWDFGAHPDAPANLSVVRPEQQKPLTAVPKPELQKR
ncbi:MAG TPA: hypothetical protein VFM77_02050 [Terriglobales bacterium]|nr:hypothetical protein [Terriglobales bacterium]